MEKNPPLVSIITLNWNGTKVTCEFLESTRKLTYPNYEILVCDMASDVDPTETINAGNYPHTKVLRSAKNLGFAAGNNWGIQHAKGDFLFIVNNDTEVTPDLLELLLEPFCQDATIGAVSPKIRYYSQPDRIQYAGYNPINMYTGRTTSVGNKEVDRGQHDTPGYTHGAHGCAMMVKRDIVRKLGMFPESFFLYYEEWDWSMRMQKAGYKIYYQAQALIFHKESMSVGKENALKVYYHTRNRILFMRRNTNGMQFLAFITFFTLFAAPKAALKFAAARQFGHLRSFVRGVASSLTISKSSAV